MRNYFEFLMKQFLTCGRSCNPNNNPVFDKIEEKQVKLEFRNITQQTPLLHQYIFQMLNRRTFLNINTVQICFQKIGYFR